jgi:hypothetical protein
MNSDLLYILQRLPSHIGGCRRFCVTTEGVIIKDELPNILRPLVQVCIGGYSRYDLIGRIHEISLDMESFERDVCTYVYPHLDSFRRTKVLLSSVDSCLYRMRLVQDCSGKLLAIIDQLMNIYSSDRYVLDMLVLSQVRICTAIQRLSHISKQYIQN